MWCNALEIVCLRLDGGPPYGIGGSGVRYPSAECMQLCDIEQYFYKAV